MMHTHFLEQEILYDGSQLSPHWIYRKTDLLDDSMVAFIGGANVSLTHMVDLEDVKRAAPIYSPRMLHFLGEWFGATLQSAVHYQYLFTFLVQENLSARGISGLRRRGNDLYIGDGKLNVSIATISPTSALIHFAINIETEGTPVPTVGLKDLGVDPRVFGAELLERFRTDYLGWRRAACKVRPV